MRRGIGVIMLAFLLGVVGYALARWQQHGAGHPHGHGYARHGGDAGHPELDWLRHGLDVSEAQMERILALHEAYHPVVEELTRRFEESHRSLAALTATATGVGPELDGALKEHAEVHLECQRAMLRHFYETAACLSPEQARRYLDKVLPFVFLHDAAGSGPHSH